VVAIVSQVFSFNPIGWALPKPPNLDLSLGTGAVTYHYLVPVPPYWNECGAEKTGLLGGAKVRGCIFLDRERRLILDTLITVPYENRRYWTDTFPVRLTPFGRKGQGKFRQLRDYTENCMFEIRQTGMCHLQVSYDYRGLTPGAEYYVAINFQGIYQGRQDRLGDGNAESGRLLIPSYPEPSGHRYGTRARPSAADG
jgi:hypothetical protein